MVVNKFTQHLWKIAIVLALIQLFQIRFRRVAFFFYNNTYDFLFLGPPSANSLNLSLNVNCSMDLIQSPTRSNKCATSLHIVPQQPWCQESPSQRSYTSVNLTLRPPSSEPQAPIDITSQNSSLTYSTSSFDSQKGLASTLQITVGPGGTGSVSSVRTRPRSSYHPETVGQEINPLRAGSLPDLAGNVNRMYLSII